MSLFDEIYYEQNPEALEEAWRDCLEENGLSESECSLEDYWSDI